LKEGRFSQRSKNIHFGFHMRNQAQEGAPKEILQNDAQILGIACAVSCTSSGFQLYRVVP
jgi:hypothetical protein